MSFINEVIKGIFIGIANIIPGVSGGTMAVSMGIYDKIIYSVTHLFQEPKKSIQTLLPYGIGMATGLIGLSFVIEFLFENYPIPTNLFFIGLILGGLPAILARIKIKRVDIKHATSFLALFALIIGMQLLNGTNNEVNIVISLVEVVKLFLIGMIASATMVIPGVSGSMMLMILGYYQPILTTINTFIKALIAFNISTVISTCLILVPFGIGVIFGIFAIAKVIEILLAKFESLTFCGILGLVVGSPIVILMNCSFVGINLVTIIISIICFIIGCIIAFNLGRE